MKSGDNMGRPFLSILAIIFMTAFPWLLMGQTDVAGSQNVLGSQRVRYANEGVTGTTLHKLAKLTGNPSTVVLATTTDVTGILGIVVAGNGTTGSADIAVFGKVLCVFDGATTAGHYVSASPIVDGDCSDAGAAYPSSNQVIGVVSTTNGGAGTYEVDLSLGQRQTSATPGPPGAPGSNGAPGIPGYSPNALVSGGYVVWLQNYDFRVSAATYYIGNIQYSSAQTDITLGAPGVNPRFDAIVVDTTGSVVAIPGTASPNPEKPTVDPATQLDLTFVFLPVASVQPPDVTSSLLYNENAGTPTEWNATASGAGFNLASLINPFVGVKDIEATAVTTGNYVNLAPAAPMDLSTASNLVLYIRSKAAWPANNKRSLQLSFLTAGGARVGSIVSMFNGQFGFTSSQTTAYQQIVVPLELFSVTVPVSNLRITVAGSGANLGFYLDYISLQAGIQPPTNPAGMTWRGTWNSTATYHVNDVVIQNSVPYVCLTSNTNSPPPSTNWDTMVTSWIKYALVKIANGVNGCANANGCWQTNGVLGANAAGSLTQDVVLFQLPANGAISQWRIKPHTACTGSTTAVTGLGTATDNIFYRLATLDIQAGPGATNFDNGVSAGGSTTTAAVNVVASLVNTVNNIDQLVAGCAIDYWARWAVLP